MLTRTSTIGKTNLPEADSRGRPAQSTAPARRTCIRTDQAHTASELLQRSVHDLQMFLDGPTADAPALVGTSPAMHQVVEQAIRFARSSATVLIVGESGTGKELLARLIHDSSRRADQAYIRVNCAALSESLIESELFGHERGAFTGAVESRIGRFEAAAGGTLLLDEISEIPLTLQAKLLRVLEEDEFQRVGDNTMYRADARIISTTNRALEDEVAARKFRSDLYHRLNVLRLDVPPLRSRKEDISELVASFLGRFCREADQPIRGISSDCLAALMRYDWPGNVRQLRNVIHHACVVNTSGTIQRCDLPALDEPAQPSVDNRFAEMRLDEIEREVILGCLGRFGGNSSAAARHLGVTARTLHNKMKRYRQEGHA